MRCGPAPPPWAMSRARRWSPSRGSARTACTPCRRPGAASTCRNAATARPGRSCRPRRCCSRRRTRRTRTSMAACRAISAAAARTSASAPPSRRPPGGPRDMTDIRIEAPSRRLLLQGATAGGLLLALRLPRAQAVEAAPEAKYGADAMPHGVVNDPHVFVSIAPDGIVTIFCHRAEMGQGVRTGMPMIVADELESDWVKVRVKQAPADEPRFGNQDTDGSRSTRHFLQPMRECGAAARQMLETAAAQRWKVAPGEVTARNRQVVHQPSGRTLGYGELAADAAKLPVPDLKSLKLK